MRHNTRISYSVGDTAEIAQADVTSLDLYAGLARLGKAKTVNRLTRLGLGRNIYSSY